MSVSPGDYVAITFPEWEGCEGRVTFSQSTDGRVAVLITEDFMGFDVGIRWHFYPNALQVIEDPFVRPETSYHTALDDFMFNV